MSARTDPPRRPPELSGVIDPELLRFGSLLIYCRSSMVLSALVYSSILALVYSDLYVHLIRRVGNGGNHPRVIPGVLFVLLVAASLFLAHRVKPRLEKAALGLLAANLTILFFRRQLAMSSDDYLALCVVSVALDLLLLTTIIAFYRRYPNYLKHMKNGSPY